VFYDAVNPPFTQGTRTAPLNYTADIPLSPGWYDVGLSIEFRTNVASPYGLCRAAVWTAGVGTTASNFLGTRWWAGSYEAMGSRVPVLTRRNPVTVNAHVFIPDTQTPRVLRSGVICDTISPTGVVTNGSPFVVHHEGKGQGTSSPSRLTIFKISN